MKRLLIILFLLSGIGGMAQRSKLRIAYVDMEMILDSMPGYQQALRELDMRVKNWKARLDKMSAEIETLKKELEAEKLMLTDDLLKEKEEIIRFKEEQMLKFQMEKFGPSGDYVIQKQLILKPIQDRVFNAVKQLVQTRHYDIVIDKSNENAGIIHISSKMDITPQVLRILRKERKKEEAAAKRKKKKSAKEKYEERKKRFSQPPAEKTEKEKQKQSLREKYEERKKRWKQSREKKNPEKSGEQPEKNEKESENN
jgi:Skp family chaperone for outer membrane proteins